MSVHLYRTAVCKSTRRTGRNDAEVWCIPLITDTFYLVLILAWFFYFYPNGRFGLAELHSALDFYNWYKNNFYFLTRKQNNMALHIKKAGILSEILSHIYDLVNSHKGKSQKKISVKVGILSQPAWPKVSTKGVGETETGPQGPDTPGCHQRPFEKGWKAGSLSQSPEFTLSLVLATALLRQ